MKLGLWYNNGNFRNKERTNEMAKYTVELTEADIQMIKDCHSKNPSIMKAIDAAKKVED